MEMRRTTTREAAAALAPSPFDSAREREDLERDLLLSASNTSTEVSASETVATAVPVTDGFETSYVAMATVVPVPLPNAAAPAGSATSGSSSRAMYSESATRNPRDDQDQTQAEDKKNKYDGFDEDGIQVRPASPPSAHGSDVPVLASYNPTKASEEMYGESQEEHSRTAARIRAANARGAMEAEAERAAAAAGGREPRGIQYHTSAAVKVANMNAEYKSRSADEGLTMEDRLAATALTTSRKAPASSDEMENPYKQSADPVGYKMGEYSFKDDYETEEYETSEYKSVYD